MKTEFNASEDIYIHFDAKNQTDKNVSTVINLLLIKPTISRSILGTDCDEELITTINAYCQTNGNGQEFQLKKIF